MKLRDLQKNWNELAKENPLWAVLTTKKDWSTDDFFNTGVVEIDNVMGHVDTFKIKLHRFKALDFGCGVGRLTQALTKYFDNVYGIDISQVMIKKAIEYDEKNKCKFIINESNNLSYFEDNSIDMVYSNITLMHIEPKYSKSYIKEFLRILKPGGIIVFSLPSKVVDRLRGNVVRILMPILKLKGNTMEMHYISEEELIQLVKDNNGEILEIERKNEGKYIFSTYYISKMD